MAVEVPGEVEGGTSSGDRGLGRVHVDVIEHGDVESRHTEAHEGELDGGVGWRVEAPLVGFPSALCQEAQCRFR